MTDNDSNADNGCGSIDINNPDSLRSAYWEHGLSIPKIAERVGVSTSTVHSRMETHDIDRRSRSESLEGVHRVERCSFHTDEQGYERWQLASVDDGAHYKVHRLLAVAEYGADAVADKAVHHKNGIKWDNRLENLELMKSGEHSSHHNSGSGHGRTDLTVEDVRNIKRDLQEGYKQSEIADRHGTNPATVSRINTGKAWSDVSIQ